MLEILQELIGLPTGYEYMLVWLALVIITISIYCLFKILLTVLLRVGGYE